MRSWGRGIKRGRCTSEKDLCLRQGRHRQVHHRGQRGGRAGRGGSAGRRGGLRPQGGLHPVPHGPPGSHPYSTSSGPALPLRCPSPDTGISSAWSRAGRNPAQAARAGASWPPFARSRTGACWRTEMSSSTTSLETWSAGGFSMPLREAIADDVYLVTTSDFMAVYAANNICRALKNMRKAAASASPEWSTTVGADGMTRRWPCVLHAWWERSWRARFP